MVKNNKLTQEQTIKLIFYCTMIRAFKHAVRYPIANRQVSFFAEKAKKDGYAGSYHCYCTTTVGLKISFKVSGWLLC
jgi:hypothetical protein